jgi:hypothetical protein
VDPCRPLRRGAAVPGVAALLQVLEDEFFTSSFGLFVLGCNGICFCSPIKNPRVKIGSSGYASLIFDLPTLGTTFPIVSLISRLRCEANHVVRFFGYMNQAISLSLVSHAFANNCPFVIRGQSLVFENEIF